MKTKPLSDVLEEAEKAAEETVSRFSILNLLSFGAIREAAKSSYLRGYTDATRDYTLALHENNIV